MESEDRRVFEPLLVTKGNPMKQRDVMRRIYRQCPNKGSGNLRVYLADEFVKAVLLGETEVVSNRYGMPLQQYARKLASDGLRKGWIYGG